MLLAALTPPNAYATSISIPYIFSPNTLIQSSQVNANFSTIASVVNGNLDNTNIIAGANINPSKLNLTTTYLNLLAATTTLGFGVGQTGDTVARGGIFGDGSYQFGVGGASATDIGWKRSAANTIQLFIPNGGGTPILNMNSGNITNVTLVAPTWTGAASGGSLTLTTPLVVGSGGVGSTTSNALTVFGGSPVVGAASQANAFNSYDSSLIFGGASGTRTLPTTGTLTGEYWHNGNWTQTGAITCNRCRWHVFGTVTINNTLTVNTELAGGPANSTAANSGFVGMGLGGGYGGITSSAGGGGGHGGAGGAGGINSGISVGGSTYPLETLLAGSGGGGGSTSGGGFAGGAGGGSFYLEATGNILFTAGVAMTATGGTGSGSGANSIACGGGGSGGGIMIRSLGNVTTTAAGTITATGGAGGTGAGAAAVLGGGGGGGGIIDISGSSVTNNGTVTAGAGAGGAGSGQAGSNGSAGTVTINQFVQLVRTAN